MRGTRPYRHVCLPPLVRARLTCSLLHAITAKGWYSPTGSRMQQVLSSLDVLVHGHGLSGHTAYSSGPPCAKESDVQFGGHVGLCQKEKEKEQEKERKRKREKVKKGKREKGKKGKGREREERERRERERKRERERERVMGDTLTFVFT